MVMRLFGVRPVRPARAERGTFSLSTARFWTEAARVVRRGVVACRSDREGLERQTGLGKRQARRASPQERGTRARLRRATKRSSRISRHRRANFTRREDVPARRRWFPSHLGFPRARPTGQPSWLTAFVRVSRRKRSSRARNASRRRRRAQPRRGRRRFSRSCCETPAFGRHDGFQKTAARRALFSRFALCHITARFSLISTITMNKHPSTGLPVGPPRP